MFPAGWGAPEHCSCPCSNCVEDKNSVVGAEMFADVDD